MEMIKLQQKFKEQHPTCTEEELNSMLPLSKMPSFGKHKDHDNSTNSCKRDVASSARLFILSS